MRLSRTTTAGLAAVLAVFGAGQWAWANPSAGPDRIMSGVAASAAPTVAPYLVTLITGDRVAVSSPQASGASVRPGAGRAHMTFAVEHDGGHLYVIPRDARRLVQTHKVDRRLFDVTALIRAGYHDAASTTMPLILSYDGAVHRQAVTAAVTNAGARVTRQLAAAGGAAVAADKPKAGALWAAITANRENPRADTAGGVDAIWLDAKHHLVASGNMTQIGAPAAWRAGYTGRGVTVAVLDTGVDSTHPDLAGRVAAADDFTSDGDTVDRNGHGTHVASILAGSGAASGGTYRGVAPESTLLAAKVCGADGTCADSAILAGMQWAVERKAAVVNLSIGHDDTQDIDPLEAAVNRLTAQYGTLFVVAAGNGGPAAGTVASPGTAAAALTVGAVDQDDALAPFSARGPGTGDGAIKPDLTAPGVGIIAAQATTAGDSTGEPYIARDGTSMAAPHVAGAAVLLAQEHPSWTGPQLKSALMGSAHPNPTLSVFEQGAGRVDLTRAVTQTVLADPPSLSYGEQLWPHTDDQPLTRTVTYRNTSTAPVSLNLSVHASGADGSPAAPGLFTVTPKLITMAAGATAAAQVTVDTRVAGPDVVYAGSLEATAGPTTVVTPLAVAKEPESYRLTIKVLGADGQPTPAYQMSVRSLDTPRVDRPYDEAGTITMRLPRATYALCGFIDTSTPTAPAGEAIMGAPALNLNRDTTISVDARTAKPLDLTVPEPDAQVVQTAISMFHPAAEPPDTCTLLHDGFADLTVGQVGGSVPDNQFATLISAHWAARDAGGDSTDSPYSYHVAEVIRGRVPTGFVKHYAASDLASVTQTVLPSAPDQLAVRTIGPILDRDLEGLSADLPLRVSKPRVEYYSTSDGVRWASDVQVGALDDDQGRAYSSAPVGYRPGTRHTEQWNGAPFGPALPMSRYRSDWVTRMGDLISVNPGLGADAQGHAGRTLDGTGRTALYRDGTLINEYPYPGSTVITVPPEAANYRLDVSADGSPDGLSTTVSVTWTFSSAHSTDQQPTALGLPVVRFAPRLDGANAVPAGRPVDIPIAVQRAPGSAATAIAQLTVEVSTDDGETWQAAALTRRAGANWVATLDHSAAGDFISLRARARDTAGTTVDQTIIRAYRLVAG